MFAVQNYCLYLHRMNPIQVFLLLLGVFTFCQAEEQSEVSQYMSSVPFPSCKSFDIYYIVNLWVCVILHTHYTNTHTQNTNNYTTHVHRQKLRRLTNHVCTQNTPNAQNTLKVQKYVQRTKTRPTY